MAIWFDGAFPFDQLAKLPPDTLVAALGIELTEAGDDWLKGRMPVDRRTRQYAGVLHGGASVAFAETLASAAGYFTLDRQRFACVGMEINANHLRPVSAGWVHGIAKAEHLGRTAQIWTIRITSDEDKLVCLSRCTLAVVPLQR